MQTPENKIENTSYTVKITGLRWADMLALKKEKLLFRYVDLRVMPCVGHIVFSGSPASGRGFRIEQIMHAVKHKECRICWIVLSKTREIY